MTTDQPTLAVTQADREAAADSIHEQKGGTTREEGMIRSGEWDDHPRVVEFARHRTHSEPRPVAGLREAPKDKALRLIRDLVVELETWDSDLLDVLRETPQAKLMREWINKPAPDPTSLEGGEGEWKPIGQETLRKGLRRSPKYFPAIGETCRMSGPNCDGADGYTWADVEVLWRDDLFVITRVAGRWPIVTKLELALFEPAHPSTQGV